MKINHSVENWISTVGLFVVVGVFFGVNHVWVDLAPLVGVDPEDLAWRERAKPAAAVLAVLSLVPLLLLQLYLTRRRSRPEPQ